MTEVAKAEPQGSQAQGAPHAHYEPDQLPARKVLIAAGGVFAGIAVAVGVVSGLFAIFGWLHPIAPAEPIQRLEQPTVGPDLQTTRNGERAAIEARALAELARYHWADNTHAYAQVPIDRAMEILAEQGWPDGEATP
ncbi:hypothetical protein [Tianweitania sediminis]|uniref:Uncharacterized protein n=1 Tax=Tianweitania sediminis TaxID=1502156 RepID=A0A8J7R2Z7_9HYPH|nr:hypothetical protein [Tianweitania sediminis]MBP0439516.1 hypothetical protein [Tianweitania sediminis]